jgi:hypothetical protein
MLDPELSIRLIPGCCFDSTKPRRANFVTDARAVPSEKLLGTNFDITILDWTLELLNLVQRFFKVLSMFLLNLESILIDVAVVVEVQTQKPKFGKRRSRNSPASNSDAVRMYGRGARGVSRIHRHPPVGGEKHLSIEPHRMPRFLRLFSLLSLAIQGGDDEFLKPPSMLSPESPSPLNKCNSGSKVQT